MFPPSDKINPASKWVKAISRFFSKRGMKVKSHDFRVTQATLFYKETKDLIKT